MIRIPIGKYKLKSPDDLHVDQLMQQWLNNALKSAPDISPSLKVRNQLREWKSSSYALSISGPYVEQMLKWQWQQS